MADPNKLAQALQALDQPANPVFQQRFPDQGTKDAFIADLQSRIAAEQSMLQRAAHDKYLIGDWSIAGNPDDTSRLNRMVETLRSAQGAAIGFPGK